MCSWWWNLLFLRGAQHWPSALRCLGLAQFGIVPTWCGCGATLLWLLSGEGVGGHSVGCPAPNSSSEVVLVLIPCWIQALGSVQAQSLVWLGVSTSSRLSHSAGCPPCEPRQQGAVCDKPVVNSPWKFVKKPWGEKLGCNAGWSWVFQNLGAGLWDWRLPKENPVIKLREGDPLACVIFSWYEPPRQAVSYVVTFWFISTLTRRSQLSMPFKTAGVTNLAAAGDPPSP